MSEIAVKNLWARQAIELCVQNFIGYLCRKLEDNISKGNMDCRGTVQQVLGGKVRQLG